MDYKGNQITYNKLSPSLKEKIDGISNDLSMFKEVPAKGVLELPSTYEDGLTVMRPTGEMAKTWYDYTVKAPTFNDTRDIIVVLTNCVNGYITEQYIQHKYYATGGTEKFESTISSVWLRAATKRVEIPPASPQLAWSVPIKTLPLPSIPIFRNPNSMWKKNLSLETLNFDTSTAKFGTLGFDLATTGIHSMGTGTLPSMMFYKSSQRVNNGYAGLDMCNVSAGYTYEAVLDIEYQGSDNQQILIRVDMYPNIADASALNYGAAVESKIYLLGGSTVSLSLPQSIVQLISHQVVIPVIGNKDAERTMVISVADATNYSVNSVNITGGSITFKTLRMGSDTI